MTHLFHVDAPAVADPGDELALQVALRKAISKTPAVKLVAIPNGAQRTAWAAMKAKQEGLASGFPDCVILGPDSLIAFVELKTKSGTLSEQQHVWLNHLTKCGFNCGVFRSVKTAMNLLRAWGFPVSTEETNLAP